MHEKIHQFAYIKKSAHSIRTVSFWNPTSASADVVIELMETAFPHPINAFMTVFSYHQKRFHSFLATRLVIRVIAARIQVTEALKSSLSSSLMT